MRWRAAPIVVLALLVSVTLTPAHAQSDRLTIERVNDDDYPFVDVTVTVPSGLTDFSLSTDAFTITENGEPRPPSLGNDPDAPRLTPPQVVLAVDVSGSMDPAIGQARDAADAFVSSLPDGSEIAIVTFGDRVDVPLDFTANVETVRAAIAGIDVDLDAGTALYDGVQRATELLPANGDAPASIIVLSDGTDTASDASERDATRTLAEHDVTLWAVALAGEEPDPATLDALAGNGGRRVTAGNAAQLEGIYADFASELSRRYLLRYESRAGGSTDIGVSVDWSNVSSQEVTTVEIDGQPRADAAAEAPVADPETFTVGVAPLGTRAAYAVGLGAFVVGTLMLWLLALSPRQPGTRQRILGEQTERTWSRLGEFAEWTTDVADRRLRNAKLGRGIDRLLEGAGLDLRPGEVAVIVTSASVVAFAVGYLGGGLLLGILLIPIPAIATRLVLTQRRDRRQTAFSDQLTDVLQLITGSLRAGYGLLQGIDAVARDGDEPAASEFRRILVEHRLGRDLSDAMEGCAERMANPDFSWVVQAIGIHRDVGGDLGRVLDNITATIRDRGDVHRQVRALSAEGRMAALVLTALPFVVLVVIQMTSPDYTSVLFSQPVGWIMLILAALLMLTGTLWIRRLVRIRY